MGKKTTAFITSIEKQQSKFKDGSLSYIRNCETLIKLNVQQYAIEEKMTLRRNELKTEANGNNAELQKLLTTDPLYLKLRKDAATFEDLAGATSKSRADTADGLSMIAQTMPNAIATFENYITKKSKSKNPFKSKKSIPAAKDFISVSKTFADAALNFCKDTLKMNFYQ